MTAAPELRSAELNGLLRAAGSAGVPRRVPSASYSRATRVLSLYACTINGEWNSHRRDTQLHSASSGSSEGVLLLSVMSEYRAQYRLFRCTDCTFLYTAPNHHATCIHQ